MSALSKSTLNQTTRKKPFLGWRVLAAATIGLALGFSNIGVASFGLFVIPLSEHFGWGRGAISIAVLLMNAMVVVSAPILGAIIDRVGVRKLILGSIVLFAAVVASLSQLKGDILYFYGAYMALTLLGIGTFPATYTRVVISWFDRRRGLAVGIAMAGIGMGAVLIPPYVQYLIEHYGWQAGYLGLAALILFVSWPAVFMLLIETPEEANQTPDGTEAIDRSSKDRPNKVQQAAIGYDFSMSIRTSAFKWMAFGFVLLGFSTSGIMTHLVPLLHDRGISNEAAALGASTLGLALVIGRIVCGILLDRIHAPVIVISFLMAPIAGLTMLALGISGSATFVAALLIGLGIGAELDFMTYLVSRYFGQRAYGKLYGLLYSAFALGAGVGPLAMGYIFEAQGSYTMALWILGGAVFIALLPFSRLGQYPDLPKD